jgi:hypothetical protein
MFCEAVQHRLRFCLGHFNCVKMATTTNKSRKGQVRQVGWVGDESHVVSGQGFPGEKVLVKRFVVMMQQSVPLSPMLGAKSSHIFMQSP